MAFIDKTDKKITEIGQGAAQKTKAVSESVRLSGVIKDEEKKQQDLCRQMGEYYYQTCKEQADGPLKDFCSQIDASKELVAQCKEQLNLAKGTRICPNCQGEVPVDSAFCSVCGISLPPLAIPEEPIASTNVASCMACGAALEADAAFCVSCGIKVTAPVAKPIEPSPVTPLLPSAMPQEAEVEEEAVTEAEPEAEEEAVTEVEPEAEEEAVTEAEPELEAEATKPKLEEQPDPVVEPRLEPEQKPVAEVKPQVEPERRTILPTAIKSRFCTGCGAILTDGILFCVNCGQKVEGSFDAPANQGKDKVVELPGSTPAKATVVNNCTQCGKALISGNLFCVSCGKKVESEGKPQPTPIPSASSASASFCVECGKELKSESLFCTNCGKKR